MILGGCPRCKGTIIQGSCLQCGYAVPTDNKYYPMLAKSHRNCFDDEAFLFERKLDGLRAIIYITSKGVRIVNRSMVDITARFPEIVASCHTTKPCVIDTEIVAYDNNFQTIQRRMNRIHDIDKAAQESPAYALAFDCLETNGVPILDKPLWQRKEELSGLIVPTLSLDWVHYSREDGCSWFAAATNYKWEGVMAKVANSQYYSGRRSSAWLKIKVRNEETVSIVGCTVGYGKRRSTFGALVMVDSNNLPCGEVGTGFTEDDLASLWKRIKEEEVCSGPLGVNPSRPIRAWCKPFNIKVSYAERTNDEQMRFPAYFGEEK